MSDLKKDLDKIGLPHQRRERKPDPKAKHALFKIVAFRALAVLLLLVVFGFGFLAISHYKSLIMGAIVAIYLAAGIYLAIKLWSLTYTGWFYTLFLAVAGILLPLLALVTRGASNPTLVTGAIVVIAASTVTAAILWWTKDLLGIKSYREIFMPFKQ